MEVQIFTKKKGLGFYLQVIIIFFITCSVFGKYQYKWDITKVDSLFQVSQIPSQAIYEEWEEILSNPGVDEAEDVLFLYPNTTYITGKEYSNGKGVHDIILAQYNNSGAQVWKKTWGGSSNDYGYGLCNDSNGNIYVTGWSGSYSNGSYDICILKYNSTGGFKWNRTWGKSGWDVGYAIVADSSGFLYVVGYTESYGGLGEIALLKYNNMGGLIWNKTFGGADTDICYDIIIDRYGNLYITGKTSSFGAESSDLLLAKFDNDGNLLWCKTWGYSLLDSGEALFLKNNNSIWVIGNTQNFGSGGNDIAIFHYNNTGALLWNETWGGADNDYGFDLAIDSENCTYLTGYTQSYSGADKDICLIKLNSSKEFEWYKLYDTSTDDRGNGIITDNNNSVYIAGSSNQDLILIKYSQKPDEFLLSSESGSLDSDGNFTLSWQHSKDADNYTLFEYSYPITEVNTSLTEIVKGNINRTYNINTKSEGIYYFLVVAHNKYGNTSSNYIQVQVKYPPSAFNLIDNFVVPDTDGIINLTWEESTGADNYSVYSHTSYIYEIDNNGTLEISGLTNFSYQIKDLQNGDYYFAILAQNIAGKTTSTCRQVVIRLGPKKFNITSSAEEPDKDGNFDIVWTKSNYSTHYLIYCSKSFISIINNEVELIENFTPIFDRPSYRYSERDKNDGIYYYKVIAVNQYDIYESECIMVTVKLPEKKDIENPIDVFSINWTLIMLIVLPILVGIFYILAKNYLPKRRI